SGRLVERRLALAQLLLALLQVGYVLHCAEPRIGLSGGVGFRLVAIPQMAYGAVGADDPELELKGRGLLLGNPVGAQDALPVVGMKQGFDAWQFPRRPDSGQSQDCPILLIAADHLPLRLGPAV